jgi:hypothetical protein
LKRIRGLAFDVDQDGALLVRVEDGSTRRVLAGDVTLRSHLDTTAQARAE